MESKSKKRAGIVLLALLWACLLAVSPAPANPGAGERGAGVSLEKAIGIAKQNVPVPPEFKQFNSSFSSEDTEGAFWNLRWFSEGSGGGDLHVTVNAVSGEIMSMYMYKHVQPGTRYSGLPRHSRQEAQKIAENFARQLQPERFAQTKLAPDSNGFVQPLPGPGIRDYPYVHYYRFMRLSDGIPVSENGINVAVNGETGEIQEFQVRWNNNLKLPPAAGRISLERARQIFNGEGLELVYVYTGSRERDTGERPYLVYQPREGGFLLDALTGKLVDPDDQYYYLYSDMRAGGSGLVTNETAALSPEESAVVEKTRGLLSIEAARNKAEQAYRLPAGVNLRHSSLSSSWSAPGSKVWYFTYANQDDTVSVNLTVDALSGELQSFSSYQREEDYKAPAVNLSEAEARVKAEELLQRLQPEKFKQVELRRTTREPGPWPKTGDPLPRAYGFNYARLVNEIPFPDNGFNVTINSTTGEITSYNLRWWNTDFPQPEGILARSKANEIYAVKNPLTLEYLQRYHHWKPEREPSYALMYRPEMRLEFMIDARTGNKLDFEGNPVKDKNIEFSDIAGHPAEQDILLLAGAGIVSSDNNLFRPNDQITGAELIAMLVSAYSPSYYYPDRTPGENEPWYQPFMRQALALGILDTGCRLDPEAPATRLQAARLLVNARGYGPLARLSALFKLEAADAGAVPEAERGYAASAAGLGLLPLKEGKFAPSDTITRGEAAQILVRALTAG
ncbi:MAG: YcdB/YcdC domain-containing protein [Bacillota bacterium]